jgi:serine/threonine-protein kinase RsbW
MEHLTVPGTLDSLEIIGKFVMQAAATAGLDRKPAYRLRLAVDEIATNIIVHGYEEAGITGTVDISSEIDAQALTIVLEDTATPYDATQAMDPEDMDRPMHERRMGGLGVFLAKQGVDKMIYERFGNRNRNSFVVYLHKDEGEPAQARSQ